jgi:ubiquinone/menaquinone biosynthesis C-methylase UbiE
MHALDMPSASLGGIVAFYSIIHLERQNLGTALAEMHRVLMPGGVLAIAFHRGEGILHEDDVLDTHVSFDCTLFEPDEVAGVLEDSGYSVVEVTVRRPYDFEYPTKRVYILAEKPVA